MSSWAAVLLAAACTVPNPNLEANDAGGSAASTATDTDSTTSAGESTLGGGTATGGSTGTGKAPDLGADPCEPAGACVPSPPDGWTGPVVVHSGPGDTPPACDSAWSTQALAAGGGLLAPPADCACACDPPMGGTCEDVYVKSYLNKTCASSQQSSYKITPGDCEIGQFPGNVGWTATHPDYVGGSCTPTTMKTVPPPEWQTAYTACEGPSQSGTCDGDALCQPQVPPGAWTCIYREGDVPCPDTSLYDTREVVYRNVEDGRDCAPCTCGPPEGGCDANVYLVQGACPGGVIGALGKTDEMCFAGPPLGFDAIHVTSATVTATCAPSPPTPQGEAIEKEPVTLCCL